MKTPKDPGLAAVLSLILPGIGQFYNGDFWRGVFWFIVTPGLWIGSGGFLGWICHVIASITAYKRAGRKNSAAFPILLVAAMSALAVPTAAQDPPRIVALGDSLTSGRGIGRDAAYPAVLQDRLADSGFTYQVVNAGVSGDTTTRALRRFRQALEGEVQILIVALGANDGLRGVPVDQLKSNLGVIIEEAQRRGISVVLVGMDALPLRGWAYSVAFHKAYEELAARYRIPLVPFVLMNVMTDASLMQNDRAHPNEAGARAIADLIWPHLQPLLKKTG